MILSTMILVSSLALFLLYLQATCENVLRQELDPERLRLVARTYRLEFPFVRKEMEQTSTPVDYRWVRMALRCDYLALTHLLKSAAHSGSSRERLLRTYFGALLLVLSAQRLLKLNGNWAVLKLTGILSHFANVSGERVGGAALATLGAQ